MAMRPHVGGVWTCAVIGVAVAAAAPASVAGTVVVPSTKCPGSWLPTFGGQPLNGPVNGFAAADPAGDPTFYVVGEFSGGSGATLNGVARWSGSAWEPLGQGATAGVDGEARAIVTMPSTEGADPIVFVGGFFTAAGGVQTASIAQWDGGAWSALGSGVDGPVDAMLVVASDAAVASGLYVAGSFATAGGVPVGNIARWDGTDWHPVGAPFPGGVQSLVLWDQTGDGGQLFAAGGAGVARLQDGDWIFLERDFEGWVDVVVVDGNGPTSSLIVGGSFEHPDIEDGFAVARYEATGAWSYLVGGKSLFGVYDLAIVDHGDGAVVYAGDSRPLRWDGAGWETIGGGVSDQSVLTPTVRTLAPFRTNAGDPPMLFVGGYFDVAGDVPANRAVLWTGSEWQQIGLFGPAGTVRDFLVHDDGSGDGDVLYIGGEFATIGEITSHGVVRWDGRSLSSVCGPLIGSVFALEFFDDGLGAGPQLHAAGQICVPQFFSCGVVRLNGSEWEALTPFGPPIMVTTMRAFDGAGAPSLYAAGFFDALPGGTSLFEFIARWDGIGWSALGDGVNDDVNAMEVFDAGTGEGPRLVLGGRFTTAGGSPASRIAQWDGSAWSTLGAGLDGEVRAMAVFDDGTTEGPALFVGGAFMSAGGIAASRIARWDGSSWSPVGSGVDGTVTAMTVFDDGRGPALWVSGGFAVAGGQTAPGLARWDGAEWTAPEEGISGSILAMATYPDVVGTPTLHLGGWFTNSPAGDANLARWQRTCPSCTGDLTGDEGVDAADLGVLLASWGACSDCGADLNGDGMVDAADLGILLAAWGPCP